MSSILLPHHWSRSPAASTPQFQRHDIEVHPMNWTSSGVCFQKDPRRPHPDSRHSGHADMLALIDSVEWKGLTCSKRMLIIHLQNMCSNPLHSAPITVYVNISSTILNASRVPSRCFIRIVFGLALKILDTAVAVSKHVFSCTNTLVTQRHVHHRDAAHDASHFTYFGDMDTCICSSPHDFSNSLCRCFF